MAIKVNTKVFNVLNQVQNSVLFDSKKLRDVDLVCWYLRTIKEDHVANWVELNSASYLAGILSGFEIDNSQDEQLKDIHTRKYL